MKYILALLPFILAGCSTYSKRQCQEMDWYREGKNSAISGLTRKQAKTPFVDKCQEDHGVVVDFVEFDRGFAVGLNQVCNAEGLKRLKAKGIRFQETCEGHFDTLNAEKKQGADLKERVKELEEEVSKLKSENAKLNQELQAKEAPPSRAPASTPEE